jgi:glycosyltransferase involved in cell wall biosynthesis
MNILHALGWYFPESLGGTEVYVASLTARLKAAGHSCAIVAPLAGAPSTDTYLHEGTRVFRYPIPKALNRAEAQGRIRVRGAEEFDNVVRSLRPDIVHFHTFLAGLGVDEVRVAREHATAVVATNHLASLGFVCQRGTLMRWGTEPCDGVCRPLKCASCELQHRGLSRPLAAAVGLVGLAFRGSAASLPEGKATTSLLMTDLIYDNQRKQAELLSLLDRFVFLNKKARNMVIANGAPVEKLALNYLGASHENVQRKPAPDIVPTSVPITIGYVGRFTRIKGVLDLARAVRSLPPSLEFTIEMHGPVGDSESLGTVKELKEIAGGDPRLRINPPIAGPDVPRVMASFDVLWVPSIWFENGPTVVSEAFAAGTPVIGTTIGAMPELIRPGIDGLLLEPGDWRSIASTIRRIVERPADTVDVWRMNVPPARTMTSITEDYLAMYSEVLAEKTAQVA